MGDALSKENYDLIIIGAGPAGLTAGIYGARAGLQTVILEKALPGGLAATTDYIENYPGFPDGIKGMELTEKMKKQAQHFGVEIIGSEVVSLVKKEHITVVKTSARSFETVAVIIATGTVPKKLNIPGEDELRGRGISYCATCDGPLFKGRQIAIIGCGNSGLQEGKFLLNFARHITFIEFLPHMTADKILQDRLGQEPKVNFLLNHELLSIDGKERVEAITVKDRVVKNKKTMEVSGVFIYAGLAPKSDFVKGIVKVDSKGFVVIDDNLETSLPGVFAAGDICAQAVRQVVTACAQGAAAAINAYHYIESLKT
jgi:thioredoxin reductase (NADPH)